MNKGILSLGKVDGYGNGRKVCEATFEWEFKNGRFSASANVWNNLKTDIIMGGQCLEEVYKMARGWNNPKAKQIIEVWREWHLNDLQPGTPAQMAYLKTLTRPHNAQFLTWEQEQLKAVNLEPDGDYKYGSRWLMKEIPAEIVTIIESW